MVGEIRDQETARIAIQAALTGHLVLSTLHTNDAPSSVTRLMNIGVEPFLISASVNGILAQRLVRRICSECKEQMTDVPDGLAAYLRKNGSDPAKLWHGRGCDKCRGTGYRSRVGIYEFLLVDNDMRRIISTSPTLNELRDAARAAGMRSLREDGLMKVSQGLTTVEEVLRVTEA
jgi:type II secretory ATPase GspE/PulE/Tfp pilus assembly ATPase PilB-like protein